MKSEHKATFSFSCVCQCKCGWSSAPVFGKGAKKDASSQYWTHRNKCESQELNKGGK